MDRTYESSALDSGMSVNAPPKRTELKEMLLRSAVTRLHRSRSLSLSLSLSLSHTLSRSLFFYKSGNYKPVSGKRTPAHTCRLPLTTYTTSPTTALVSWTAFEHTRRVPWSTFLSGKHSTVIYRFQCNLVFKSIKLSSGSKNVQFCGDFSTSLYFVHKSCGYSYEHDKLCQIFLKISKIYIWSHNKHPRR